MLCLGGKGNGGIGWLEIQLIQKESQVQERLLAQNLRGETPRPLKWQEKLADELHKPIRRNFPKRRVIVHNVDDIWCSDLVDM